MDSMHSWIVVETNVHVVSGGLPHRGRSRESKDFKFSTKST